MPFLDGVECSNGSFRPCEDLAWQESVVYWWTARLCWPEVFSVDFATHQPLKASTAL